MKNLLLFIIIAFALASCKTEEVAAPELAQKIVGTYTLSKVYKGTTILTGATGSAIVSVKDNSTVNLNYKIKIGNSSTEITNSYTVVADGSNYLLNVGTANQGSVVGNKLTLGIVATVGLTSDTYNADFVK